jgi:hypothetical protein
MFDKLIDWMKANAKEGADLEALATMVPSWDDIAKAPELKPHLDRYATKAIETHDARFQSEKLPEILKNERDKIRAELNPEETPEQKRIRELEERLQKADADNRTRERRDILRKKAQELGIGDIGLSAEDIEPFVMLGDDAPAVTEALIGKLRESMTKTLDAKLKEKYAGPAPEKGSEPEGNQATLEERMKSTWLK